MTHFKLTAGRCSRAEPSCLARLTPSRIALAALTLAAPAVSAAADPAPGPRFEGVYAFTPASGTSAPSTYAVRFYADGIAVETSVQGDLQSLAQSLHRDNPALFPARWNLENGRLVLNRSEGFRETTRAGKLTPRAWEITDKVAFTFTPMRFAQQPASSANRRPMFVGVGKAVKEFEYDAAGRRTGHTWLLKVQAADPDNDPVRVTWKTLSGKIVGEGLEIRWKPAGRETLSITLDDGRAGVTVAHESFD